jgi:hypothetical protein
MFSYATAGQPKPKHLSTDHDPLFRFHRWLANLRVLEIEEIKSVPCAPVSHPFVERLIGTIRREYFDRAFFWNAVDLARKLSESRPSLARRHDRPRNALVDQPLFRSRLIVPLGRSIAAVCFRPRLPLDWEFARL